MVGGTTTVTTLVEFDAGHRVPFHKSKCKHCHGHRFKLEVTFIGAVKPDISGESDAGMVIDFSEARAIVKSEIVDCWDHKFLAWDQDHTLIQALSLVDGGASLVVLNCIPTAENLVALAFQRIDKALCAVMSPVQVAKLRLYETPNNWSEYVGGTRNMWGAGDA